MAFTFVFGVALVAAPGIWAQVPIPARPVGFVYSNGSADAPIQFDAFIDLECPDGKAAYPVFLQVADYYGPATLRMTVHIFPLPYHRNAFLAAQGAHIASQAFTDPTASRNAVTGWIKTVYTNLINWNTAATTNMTQIQVTSLLSSYAAAIGVSPTYFQAAFNLGIGNSDARIAWKYACTRGVAASPWSFVNGIQVDADETWTLAQWKQVIDPLVKKSMPRLTVG